MKKFSHSFAGAATLRFKAIQRILEHSQSNLLVSLKPLHPRKSWTADLKRFLLLLLGIVGLTAASIALFLRFGLGVTSPGAVFDVAGGMAAKLGCSARYVTGLGPAQVKEDLASYAAFYGLVSITNEDGADNDVLQKVQSKVKSRVVARLPPGSEHSATYRRGLGCSLDIGDTKPLDALKPAAWPQPSGDALANTGTANKLLKAQLSSDNKAGLNTRAFAVMQSGKLIGEAHAEGFDSKTMHLGWSMGKSVIAILFGRLEMQLGISTSRSNLFDQWADERSTVSLENMLRMTSGLDFEEVYAPGSDATRMLFNTHSAASGAMNKPLGRPPGTHFAYSSGTTNVLGRFLYEQLGGTDHAYRFLHRELLVPLAEAGLYNNWHVKFVHGRYNRNYNYVDHRESTVREIIHSYSNLDQAFNASINKIYCKMDKGKIFKEKPKFNEYAVSRSSAVQTIVKSRIINHKVYDFMEKHFDSWDFLFNLSLELIQVFPAFAVKINKKDLVIVDNISNWKTLPKKERQKYNSTIKYVENLQNDREKYK